MPTYIGLPRVNNKITLFINSACRDAVEHLEEGKTHSDLEISTHGQLRMYEDGHKVFEWKGVDVIVFYPMKTIINDEGEPELEITYDKLYEDID